MRVRLTVRRVTGPVVVLIGLMLAGCVGTSAPGSASEPSSGHYDLWVDSETGEPIDSSDSARWTDADRLAAIDAAVAAVTAFARPDLSYEAWWGGLTPHLDDNARRDYAYVTPAVIPARAVIGGGTITDGSSAWVARVAVPTDSGVYEVVVSRAAADGPWLVARFVPPTSGVPHG